MSTALVTTGTAKPVKTRLSNQIKLVIHGSNNQICADSRYLAKESGREHKSVLRTIDELIADKTISRHEFVPRNYKKRGKEYRYFELNKAGFLKAMPFIGGKESRECQKRLVDEFLKLELKLERQSKEREKLACQVARLSGKDSRAILTDEIKKFVSYAKLQGSGNADRYYSSITNAAHNALVILEPKATEVRELLTAIQLSRLATIELTAAQVLTEQMDASAPYKEIYQAVKLALSGFAVDRESVLGG